MATPVGHSLLGAAIGVALSRNGDRGRGAAVGAVAGMAADLDFIPGLLIGEMSRFHHAQSHSFAFAVLAAVIAMLIAPEARRHWGLLVGLSYASHLGLDLLTLDDSPPHGIPIFWPWSWQVFQSPVPVFPNVLHGNGQELSVHNIGVALREVALLGPLLAGVLFFTGRRRQRLTVQQTPSLGHPSWMFFTRITRGFSRSWRI